MAEQKAASGTYSTPYKFTGKELDDDTGLYYYGARYYDPRVSQFLSVDPLADKYAAWSPYTYTLNNPVRFVDPDGKAPKIIDPSNLSKSELKTFNARIKRLKANELFNTFYTRLEKYETTYYIKSGSGHGGSGSFNPRTNEIHAVSSDHVFAQEAFHAYQKDLGVYNSNDYYVRETEGDIVSFNIAMDISLSGFMGNSWDDGIIFEFGDKNGNFNESVLSESFDRRFNETVESRIDFYKNSRVNSPKGYIQANSGVGALALKKLMREVIAKKIGIEGPRLSNGDFYE